MAKLYNSRDVSYQRVIKQLTDLIQESAEEDSAGKSPPSDGSDLIC